MHTYSCNAVILRRYIDSFMWEKSLWIVMSYMGGGSLTDLVTECRRARELACADNKSGAFSLRKEDCRNLRLRVLQRKYKYIGCNSACATCRFNEPQIAFVCREARATPARRARTGHAQPLSAFSLLVLLCVRFMWRAFPGSACAGVRAGARMRDTCVCLQACVVFVPAWICACACRC